MVLAIWFMDDGSKGGSSLKIAKEIQFLCNILLKLYNIKASVQKAGINKGYTKKFMENFINIIKPYMHKSMYYKLHE